MRAVFAVALLAGCQNLHDPNPITPGGPAGPGSNTTEIDAREDIGDGGTELGGRVCLVTDLRSPSSGCATSGADNITVTLGTKTTLTNQDGTFTIEAPTGSNLVWHAAREDLITSAVSFSTDFTIPAITIDDYAELLGGNGVLLTPGQGSLIIRVVQAASLLAGATATVNPVSQFAPFYDGNSASSWDRDTTDVRGTIWITGASAGATVVAITPSVGATPVSNTFLVEDSAITFATVEIP
jgi:hypothetical protein